MLSKIFHLFMVAGVLAQFSIAQSADSEKNRRIERANEILKAAREVIYKGIDKSDIKTIQIEKQITSAVEAKILYEGEAEPQETKSRVKIDKEVMARFPDRLKSVTTTYMPEMDENENFSKMELVANGEEVEVKQLSVFNGKEFDMKEALKTGGMSKEEIEKQIKKVAEAQREMETKEFVRQNLWADVFPVLLDLPWEIDTRFVYLGKAQAGDKRANILEYVPTDKEKAQQKKHKATGKARLFFDEKTHLLLMLTAELLVKKSNIKTKYFFSDYEEEDGILVAKRINAEAITSNDEGVEFAGKKTVRGSSKTISEIIVKKFKINPTFKKGTFEVKKKKRTQGDAGNQQSEAKQGVCKMKSCRIQASLAMNLATLFSKGRLKDGIP